MVEPENARGSASRANVLNLPPGILEHPDPRIIALSLKRAADDSQYRKANPFNSAMSMLSLYLNRAGDELDAGQRAVLEAAKDELRRLYDRPVRG